jgi:hypothetical protein
MSKYCCECFRIRIHGLTSLCLPVFRESLEIPERVHLPLGSRSVSAPLAITSLCDCQGAYFRTKRIDTRENPCVSGTPCASAGHPIVCRKQQRLWLQSVPFRTFGIRVRYGAASKFLINCASGSVGTLSSLACCGRSDAAGNSRAYDILVATSPAWGSVRISYTWSKAIDDISEFFFSTPINNFDPGQDRSRSDDDQRNRVVFDASLTSSTKRADGWIDHVTHGWRLGGILQYYSPLPFNITTGANTKQAPPRDRALRDSA